MLQHMKPEDLANVCNCDMPTAQRLIQLEQQADERRSAKRRVIITTATVVMALLMVLGLGLSYAPGAFASLGGAETWTMAGVAVAMVIGIAVTALW